MGSLQPTWGYLLLPLNYRYHIYTEAHGGPLPHTATCETGKAGCHWQNIWNKGIHDQYINIVSYLNFNTSVVVAQVACSSFDSNVRFIFTSILQTYWQNRTETLSLFVTLLSTGDIHVKEKKIYFLKYKSYITVFKTKTKLEWGCPNGTNTPQRQSIQTYQGFQQWNYRFTGISLTDVECVWSFMIVCVKGKQLCPTYHFQ